MSGQNGNVPWWLGGQGGQGKSMPPHPHGLVVRGTGQAVALGAEGHSVDGACRRASRGWWVGGWVGSIGIGIAKNALGVREGKRC
jgi:hypothetical protein